MAVLAFLIFLAGGVIAQGIQYLPVSNSYNPATESQVLNFVSEDAIGAFSHLKVGSTYIANRIDIASNVIRAYFFFKPTLQGPISQSNITDSSIMNIVKTLVLESKLMIVVSGDQYQRTKRFTLIYDTVSEKYTKLSTVNSNHPDIAPFSGLSADLTQSRVAYLLGSENILYKWSPETGFGLSCTVLQSIAFQMQPYGPSLFVYGDTSTSIQLVDPTSMSIAQQLDGDQLGSYFRIDSSIRTIVWVVDNIDLLRLVAIDIDKLTNYGVKLSKQLSAPSRGALMDFGMFQFLGMVDSENTMTLMHKKNLEKVDSGLFESSFPFIGFLRGSMAQATDRAFEYPIFHLVKGSNCVNAHLYYFRFDLCSRNPSGNCESCSSGYYLSKLLDKCLPVATGLKQNLLGNCSVANCIECSDSIDTCNRCTAAPAPLFVFNNTCIPSSISGYGPAGEALVPCQDSQCVDCSGESNICLECNTTTGWIQAEGGCIPILGLQATRQGVNRYNNRVVSCLDPQCLDCTQDHMKCNSCDISNGFVLSTDTGTCIDGFIGTKSSRILTSFSEVNRTVNVRFMGPIDTNVTDTDFDISLTDLVDFRTPENCSRNGTKVAVRLVEVAERYLVFSLSTDRQIIDGELTFSLAPNKTLRTRSGTALLGFPAVQEGVQVLLVNTSAVAQIGEITGSVLNNAKLALTVLLAATNTKSLGSPNYIFSQQSILALLEGPWVDLPDQILYNSIQYIQGVPPLPNPFLAMHGEDETCDLPPRYARLEMKCSYTLNFGAPILAICIVLLVAATVEWLYNQLSQQLAKTTSSLGQSNISTSANTVIVSIVTAASSVPKSKGFGLSAVQRSNLRKLSTKLWWIETLKPFRFSFAVDYVESLLAEILLYSFLNLTKQPGQTSLKIGTILSMLSFTVVGVMLFTGLRGGLGLKQICSQINDKPTQNVDKVIDLEKLSSSPFLRRFGDHCLPLQFPNILQAFTEYVRCFLFAYIVIGFRFQPLIQVCCMICVQTLHIANFMICYRKKSQQEKWVTLWIETQFWVYMVLKLVVLLDADTSRAQNLTGMVMAILLVSLQFTAIVLQTYGLLLGLYKMIKSRRQQAVEEKIQNFMLAKDANKANLASSDRLMASTAGSAIKIESKTLSKQKTGKELPMPAKRHPRESKINAVLDSNQESQIVCELEAQKPADLKAQATC